jgi:hypothetical protein
MWFSLASASILIRLAFDQTTLGAPAPDLNRAAV